MLGNYGEADLSPVRSWVLDRVGHQPTSWARAFANFYEKALFVKGDVATALWWKQLLFALRAMLLFALSGSSLGSSVHYEIRLFKLEALQSSERSSWKGRTSSLPQSPC